MRILDLLRARGWPRASAVGSFSWRTGVSVFNFLQYASL
jgi:hypothetical protein